MAQQCEEWAGRQAGRPASSGGVATSKGLVRRQQLQRRWWCCCALSDACPRKQLLNSHPMPISAELAPTCSTVFIKLRAVVVVCALLQLRHRSGRTF